jgi:hypothetical protein
MFKYEDQLFGLSQFRVEGRLVRALGGHHSVAYCFVQDGRIFDVYGPYHSRHLCLDACLSRLYVLYRDSTNLACCLGNLDFCRLCAWIPKFTCQVFKSYLLGEPLRLRLLRFRRLYSLSESELSPCVLSFESCLSKLWDWKSLRGCGPPNCWPCWACEKPAYTLKILLCKSNFKNEYK